jgi:hypothetical protein
MNSPFYPINNLVCAQQNHTSLLHRIKDPPSLLLLVNILLIRFVKLLIAKFENIFKPIFFLQNLLTGTNLTLHNSTWVSLAHYFQFFKF